MNGGFVINEHIPTGQVLILDVFAWWYLLHIFPMLHIGVVLSLVNDPGRYKFRYKRCLPLLSAVGLSFSVSNVFQVAFENVFHNKSFYQQKKMNSSLIPFAKDTFYRLMNSSCINWRKFTLQLGKAVIQKIVPLTSESRRNVLIIDDSLFSRARSKNVELMAKVFDHVEHKYTRGFRLLTLGWSDGNSFLPLSHCLLSSANRENRLQEASDRIDSRSNSGKQRKLAQSKATVVMQKLLAEAKAMEIPAQYVLFDTWFCSPSSLVQVKGLGFDVIAMVKKSEKSHFLHDGCMKSVMAIFRQSKKRRGSSKYLLSVEAAVAKDGKTLPVKLVFVRNRNNPKDYLVLVSTDVSLSEEEIIQTYGKRWNIEVFFKMCKSFLKLGYLFSRPTKSSDLRNLLKMTIYI